jgi:hypothetical protein
MGFQTFDLPKGLFSWMTRNYLKFMLSIIHPDGGKRIREYGEHLTPKMILMERGDLLSWKDRSGRERPSRMERREAKTPALPLDHGASADQLGV